MEEDKIEAWLRELDEWKAKSEDNDDMCLVMDFKDCGKLLALVRVYREANQFYANANWQLDISQETIEEYSKRAHNDTGHRARTAEEKAKEIVKGK